MQDHHRQETVSALQAMGFEQATIDRAYENAPIKTVEGLINWIDSSQNANMDTNQSTPMNTKMDEENPSTMVESPGEPISDHVDAGLRDQLISLGFQKNPAEKALFMTQSRSLDEAMMWLEENKNEPDFNEPLFIVNQGPKLTPEEAKQKARELQAQIRARRAEKDKELERQREADRIRTGREMQEARRKMEDQEVKNNLYMIQKEKEEKERAMAKVLAEIEKDRFDRTGKHVKVLRPAAEVYSDIFKKMTKVYPIGSMSAAVLKKCLETIVIYLSNSSINNKLTFSKTQQTQSSLRLI